MTDSISYKGGEKSMKKKNLRKEMVFGAVVCAILVLCSAYATIAAEKNMKATFGTDPLIADAHGPYYAPIDEPIQLYGSATGGVPKYSYEWNFGDGSPHSYKQNPKHTYHEVDNFTVTLTVTDCTGNTSTDTTWANITNWCLTVYIHTVDLIKFYWEFQTIYFEGYVGNEPLDCYPPVDTPPVDYRVWRDYIIRNKTKTLDIGSFPDGIRPGFRYPIYLRSDVLSYGFYKVCIEATAGNVTKCYCFLFFVLPPILKVLLVGEVDENGTFLNKIQDLE